MVRPSPASRRGAVRVAGGGGCGRTVEAASGTPAFGSAQGPRQHPCGYGCAGRFQAHRRRLANPNEPSLARVAGIPAGGQRRVKVRPGCGLLAHRRRSFSSSGRARHCAMARFQAGVSESGVAVMMRVQLEVSCGRAIPRSSPCSAVCERPGSWGDAVMARWPVHSSSSRCGWSSPASRRRRTSSASVSGPITSTSGTCRRMSITSSRGSA